MVHRAWICASFMRIAIIAALPGELKPLVKHWQRIATGDKRTKKWTLFRDTDTWIAVCAGMGAEAARKAYAAAVSDGLADMLVSIGWLWSLAGSNRPAHLHLPSCMVY